MIDNTMVGKENQCIAVIYVTLSFRPADTRYGIILFVSMRFEVNANRLFQAMSLAQNLVFVLFLPEKHHEIEARHDNTRPVNHRRPNRLLVACCNSVSITILDQLRAQFYEKIKR